MVTTTLSTFASLGQQWRRGPSVGKTDQVGQTFHPVPDWYELAEDYYSNKVYERADAKYYAIKAWQGLPRNIRPVLSLVAPAVNWWPESLYGGTWTTDGLPTSEGQPNRVPYDARTPEELRLAVQQAFAWGNFQSQILLYALLHTMLGEVFAEVEVDYERRKVYPVVHHPKFITNIEWNRSGDVTMFRIDIPQVDERGKAYKWGKVVTKETVTTLLDGEPHGYDDLPAVSPNVFGFVPAVWVMNRDVGGQHGASVFQDLWTIIDELQGLVSSAGDFIHKFTRQGVIVETTDPKGFNSAVDASAKRGATAEFSNPNADRESVTARGAPPGTRVHRLIENLGLAESDPHIQRLVDNVYVNLPELSIEEKLADLTNLTGPGARYIVAPMQRRVNEVSGNSYSGIVKLGQMCVSIMGELVNTGQFGLSSQLTNGQKLFEPFRLNSYEKGELAFSLKTPLLVRPTAAELAAEAKMIESLTTPWGLQHVGLSNDEIYGKDLAPEIAPGLLDQQEEARTSASSGFANLFNAGGVAA